MMYMWKWSHYAIVEAVEPFKLHPTSMSYIYKVVEHLKQLWIDIWQHIHTVSTTDNYQDLRELAEILVDGSHGLGPSGSVMILQDTWCSMSLSGPFGRNVGIILNDKGLNLKSKGSGIFFSIFLLGGFLGIQTLRGPKRMSQSFLSGMTHNLHSPMKVRKSFFCLGGSLEHETWLITRWQVSNDLIISVQMTLQAFWHFRLQQRSHMQQQTVESESPCCWNSWDMNHLFQWSFYFVQWFLLTLSLNQLTYQVIVLTGVREWLLLMKCKYCEVAWRAGISIKEMAN